MSLWLIAAVAFVVLGLVVRTLTRRQEKYRAALGQAQDSPPSEFTLEQLLLMQTLVAEEKDRIEKRKREIIDQGAREGKTISTERALRYAEELKANYMGPDREEYVREIEAVMAEFREKYGPEIPVDEAYRLIKGV